MRSLNYYLQVKQGLLKVLCLPVRHPKATTGVLLLEFLKLYYS